VSRLLLIVEDDLPIREILRELFIDEGYRVVEAANGLEALQRLEEALPDLIVLDLWMPVMTGGELMQRLKADPRFASVPVLVLTAATEDVTGAPVVKKPVGLEELLAKVAEKLSGGGG
jgi:chemosensory pili system protein ChpA (sensor histidine kinase/response regulator)